MKPESTAPANLGRITLILGALTAFTPLAIDMYLPALPAMEAQFSAAPGQVQFTLALYFIGLALGQVVFGPLSDRYGRLKPLFTGGVIFVLASLACALAPDVETLSVLRFVQALGGSSSMVVARAMVRDIYPPREVARAFSLLMLVLGVAPILAPMLGSYMLIWFGWQAIFLTLALVSAVVLVPAWLLLKESHPGPYKPLTLGGVLGAYGKLLVDRNFLGYTLASGLPTAGMFAYIAGSPFLFIQVYGLDPQHYGWLFGANAVGMIAASQINRTLLKRFSPESMIPPLGLFQAAVTAVFLAAVWIEPASVWLLIVPLFFVMAPQGMLMPNGGAAALSGVGQGVGTASALIGILQFAMGGISSALVGALADGTGRPMALIMLVGTFGGWLARALLVKPRS
ncbi:Bcr/CflA family multidrug efflux MFS transporter [Ferrovibrio sp.]|uniref:Bcr/CflA family multidrug efflux MFS transporter n=1 Tax=Ferrovibrio sp. TaxID=1917215 RepID=UPI0035B06830